jgi:hypothetical protein
MAKATISKTIANQVKQRDSFICRACGFGGSAAYAPYLDCDHIQAESEGGATNLDNLQTLCKACNIHKNTNCWTFPARCETTAESVWTANQKVVETAFTVGVKRNEVKKYLRKLR